MLLKTALTGFSIGGGLIVAIGAQNAFVLREGLKRRHVALVVSICAISDIFLILIGIAGVGVFVEEYPGALGVLRMAGAGFLAVYGMMAAWRSIRGKSQLIASSAVESSAIHVAMTCLAFTFLNPHVYLDTLVLLGGFAAQYQSQEKWVFAAGACIASIVWFASLGFGARLLQTFFQKPLAWRILDAGIAILMIALSIKLLVG